MAVQHGQAHSATINSALFNISSQTLYSQCQDIVELNFSSSNDHKFANIVPKLSGTADSANINSMLCITHSQN